MPGSAAHGPDPGIQIHVELVPGGLVRVHVLRTKCSVIHPQYSTDDMQLNAGYHVHGVWGQHGIEVEYTALVQIPQLVVIREQTHDLRTVGVPLGGHNLPHTHHNLIM